jgi:predicted TIM-barrel fold metal-dependent hydrolase
MGVRALWIGSDALEGRAPSHSAYGPLWAVLEEAGVPVTLPIGSGRHMGGAPGRLNILSVINGHIITAFDSRDD